MLIFAGAQDLFFTASVWAVTGGCWTAGEADSRHNSKPGLDTTHANRVLLNSLAEIWGLWWYCSSSGG